MTISGDDYEDRRTRRRRNIEDEIPPQRTAFSDHALVSQGYRVAAEYKYEGIDGRGLYFSRRYESPHVPGDKQFRQGRYDSDEANGIASDAGFSKVPYRWPALRASDPTETVYWCEGEKDADMLASLGLIATTAAGQKLSALIAKTMTGRNVVVLVDNDHKGEENAENAVDAFRHYAESVRVVRLPGLRRSEDVTDWLELRGGTVEKLKQIVEEAPPLRAAETFDEDAPPFAPQALDTIERREWLYKPAYIRAEVSFTAGTGARGKSTLIVSEALAMVSGKPLLGITPAGKQRVWYANLEDDMKELKRKFNAAIAFHELPPADIGDRLYVESAVGREIIVAMEEFKRGATLNRALLDKISRIIRKRRCDVVIFDPFISMHRVSENDNPAMDMVVKALKGVAQETGCAIMLVHHTRKPNGEAGGVDDLRGAVSLANAARYVRVLNPMTAGEAEGLGIDPEKRGFYFSATDGKTNLTPPAANRDWFKLESFELGNGGGFEIDGDDVGVATRCNFAAPASALANLTAMQVAAAFRVGGPWRYDRRADNWAGKQLAQHLDIGAETKAEKDALDRTIRGFVHRGWLVKFTEKVDRKDKDFVKLPDGAPVTTTGAPELSDAA